MLPASLIEGHVPRLDLSWHARPPNAKHISKCGVDIPGAGVGENNQSWLRRMAKELTVREMASMGGRSRAKAHSKTELRAWGKQGGRPTSFDEKAVARLRRLVDYGKSRAECAFIFGVSVRTLGRVVSRMNSECEI
jgi:hypothetical protein